VPAWGGDGHVYEPYVLLRSYLLLRERSSIAVPGDVQALVDAVYSDDVLPVELSPELRQALQDARIRMGDAQDKSAYKALLNLVDPPDSVGVLGPSRELEEDNPELHETYRALTRDAPPSVTLVCLHGEDGRVVLEPGGAEVPLEQEPPPALARELAQRTVGVSHYTVLTHFLAQKSPAGWQEHPALRYYRAAVFIGGRCDIGSHILSLDRELGLTIKPRRSDEPTL